MALHYAVLVDPPGRHVLLRDAGGAFSLPRFEAEPAVYGEVGPLCRAAEGQLGVEVRLLGCLGDTGEARIYLFETHEKSRAGWHEVRDLPPFAEAWQRDVVQRCLAAGGAGEAWGRPGWFDETVAWLRGELRRAGEDEVQSVEQVRVWEFSCLLRIHGARGNWYLKAVPPLFEREPAILGWLSRLRPHDVPALVAHDPVHRRFLMPECRGVRLNEIADLAAWTATVEAYARLQIACVGRRGELAALGCPERSLAGLADHVDTLLADEAAMLVGEEGGLTPREVASLRARAPELKSACDQLDRAGVPTSIEHGDLWEANVIVGSEGPSFLDWTDASLAHPFLSLLPLFLGGGLERRLAHVPDARARLRDAYLGPWRELLPDLDLTAVFELAQTAAALHHAANYHSPILRMVRTEHSARELLPFFLRSLLDDPESVW